MSLKLSNILVSYVIFSMLVVMTSQFYDHMSESYNVTPTDLDGNKTIMQQFSELNLPEGMQSLLEGAVDITNPSSSNDIVGGFLSVGIGFFKTATGLLTFPIGIIGIVTNFYFIPTAVESALGLIALIYIAIMVINKTTGGDD